MNNPYQTNHQPDPIERTVPGPNAKQIDNAIEGVDLLFDLQRDLEARWNRLPHPAEKDQVSAYIRETVLCAEDELHEVLAEVHWKPWKNKSGIKDRDAYREELADVLHFVLDLYLAAGLTGKDFVMDYIHKHYKNVVRTKSTAYKES